MSRKKRQQVERTPFDHAFAQTANWPAPGEEGEFFFAVVESSVAKIFDVLFAKDSDFMANFHVQRNHTNLSVGAWNQSVHENEVSQEREITYLDNAASVFVDRGYPVYEKQQLVSSGSGCYVCYSYVRTPTVPYGDSLEVVVQYCIAAAGKDTSLIRISYHVNYLKPTIMRKFINNGIEVSMRKHFQDFYRLLSETMVMSKISDRQREAIKLTQQMLQERPLTPDTSSNVLLTVQAQHVLGFKFNSRNVIFLLAVLYLIGRALIQQQVLISAPSSAQLCATTVLVLLVERGFQQLLDHAVPRARVFVEQIQSARSLSERMCLQSLLYVHSIRKLMGHNIMQNADKAKCEQDLDKESPIWLEAVGEEIQQDWIEEEFFENERFQPFRGFGSTFPGHLLPTDRNRWSDRSGTMLVSTTTTTQDNEDFFGVAPRAPRGWCFVDDWRVDITGLAEHRVDEDGWSYAFDFTFLEFPPSVNSNKATTTTFVRRRRWTRHRVPVAKLQNEFQKHGNHSTPLESMPAATKAVSSQSLKLIAVARDADIKHSVEGARYDDSPRSSMTTTPSRQINESHVRSYAPELICAMHQPSTQFHCC
mmetsp:Transcript_19523/g.37692  ORF Transcript_19523/g.37692 Transcript_19523/m.37692 type:complete len:591 (-) Transcript_19523:700-2472(-)